MANYALNGKLFTTAEQREALLAILSEAAAFMQTVDGCYLYMVSKDAEDDTAVWVTEVWRDEAAHAASLTIDAVKALIGKGIPLLQGQHESYTLIPVAGMPKA